MIKGDYYLFDDKEFHVLAKRWMKSKSEWKKTQILLGLLSVCILIAFFMTITYIRYANHFILNFMLVTILETILIISFIVIIIFSRQNYGFPYLYMKQIYLSHDTEKIQLIYHNGLDKRNYASAIIQEIDFCSIRKAKIDEELHMLTLIGETRIMRQSNIFCMNKFVKPKIKKNFSIFLCFSDSQQFLNLLKSRGVQIDYV